MDENEIGPDGLIIDAMFEDEETGDTVLVEDDGVVAYAYYVVEEELVGSVWLYNHGEPPTENQDEDRLAHGLPPRNTSKYTKAVFTPLADEEEVDVEFRQDGKLREAVIMIRGQVHAILAEDEDPGRCVLATSVGPLAQPL